MPTSIQTTLLELNPLIVDEQGILDQFLDDLLAKDSWKDAVYAAAGRQVATWITAGVSFNQHAIERAQQELYFGTALSPSSIYELCRTLGVHIQRNIPAQVTVNFTRSDTSTLESLPPYSSFDIDGVSFFNRVPIVFNVGDSAVNDVILYQGEVNVESFVSDGTADQRFKIGNEDFTISDQDVLAQVGDPVATYQSVQIGLWHYGPNDLVFFEGTLGNGQVECRFGNDAYGHKPHAGWTINIYYAVTLGSAGNKATSGLDVSPAGSTTITGLTTTTISGGGDYKDHQFYKVMGADIGAANNRAVTRRDYRALALEYPGVLDAIFRGQAELAPNDKNFMNVIGVTLLTETAWNGLEFNRFLDYIGDTAMNQGKGLAVAQYVRQDPVAVPVTVSGTIYCFNRVDLQTALNQATTAIQDYYRKTVGSLGKQYRISDLTRLLTNLLSDFDPDLNLDLETRRMIDYVEFTSPTTSLLLTKLQYAQVTVNLTAQYSTRNQVTLV